MCDEDRAADLISPLLSDTSPYQNRWVAVVHGRVVSVGLNREQAYRAAKRIRPKDKPALLYINAEGQPAVTDNRSPTMNMEQSWIKQHNLLQATVNVLQGLQIEAYLVGGAVRDFLMGRDNIYDFDFAVPGDGLAVARKVANALDGAFYPLDAERGTGRIVFKPASEHKGQTTYLDFATFRGENLLTDLGDRDFTINALALSLHGTPRLIDPTGGQSDLEAGQIRATSETVFQHDPLRVLRAVRQAAEFGFTITAKTERLAQQSAPLLAVVSPERQREELLKLLNTTAPGRAMRMLYRLEILPHILPEVAAMADVKQSAPHYLDVFQHTSAALDAWTELPVPELPGALNDKIQTYLNQTLTGNLTNRQLIPLGILLHDVGKPATRTETVLDDGLKIQFIGHEQAGARITREVMHRFRFSGQTAGFVETVVAHHMRPLLLAGTAKVSRRATYRFFRDCAGAGYQAGVAIALLAMVDHRATYQPGTGLVEGQHLLAVIEQLLTTYFEAHDQVVEPVPLLSGKDLIDQFGLRQGRQIGLLLQELKEAQAFGQVSSQADAIAFVKSQIDFAGKQSDNL